VANWLKCLPFSSIGIYSLLAEVSVEPSLAVVEKVREMIMKGSGKF